MSAPTNGDFEQIFPRRIFVRLCKQGSYAFLNNSIKELQNFSQKIIFFLTPWGLTWYKRIWCLRAVLWVFRQIDGKGW